MFRQTLTYFKGFYLSIIILAGILVFGILGYMYFEDYVLLDAFYMTLITVSTVGYKEVQPLSDSGKLFTSFLILSSFGTFAYAASSIGVGILSGKYRYYFKNYRLEQEIQKLKNHVIICGYGNNGESAAQHLITHNLPFVVLEKDSAKLESLKEAKNMLYLEADAIDESNFLKAGIEQAKAIITTLPSDADNVFVVLTARQLNPNLTIISRATNPKTEAKLRFAGANNVIMPDRVGGNHMAALVTTPDVYEFLDKLSLSSDDTVNLEELIVTAQNEKQILVSDLENIENCLVRIIGIKKAKGKGYALNPKRNVVIENGDKIFILGQKEHTGLLRKKFGLA
ncbi:MAG: potassium channel protein [Bacteroidetes bacterium]|nr:potassium channel protein [Bacteroidota bacterium]